MKQQPFKVSSLALQKMMESEIASQIGWNRNVTKATPEQIEVFRKGAEWAVTRLLAVMRGEGIIQDA